MANGGETKMVEETVPMAGGDGPQSYAQNSTVQKLGLEAIKELINEGIKDKLDFKNPCFEALTTFRIADVGCSTGSNTFYAVQNIIEAVNHKYQTQIQNPPPFEFQVFFNDLTNNDFNTLFKTLPFYQKYFAGGVPGSFYSRLFPKDSIHFVHSSYSLHWLSKIPRKILETPALNKESIYCSRLVKEVTQAYSDQFKNDMDAFLNARAEEIVGGGLMAILIGGHPNEDNFIRVPSANVVCDVLGDSLREMAKLGVISEERVDSFNIPLYDSTSKEIDEIVKGNGHFSIERLESLKRVEMKADVKLVALHLRASVGGLLKEHFRIGEDILDKIFQSFAEKIADDLSIFDAMNNSIELFILLKRNIDKSIIG